MILPLKYSTLCILCIFLLGTMVCLDYSVHTMYVLAVETVK